MWLQAHLTIDKDQASLVELLFENLGAVAVTLGDAADQPMLEPGPGEMPLWQSTRISGLFSGDTDSDKLRSAINQALAQDFSRQLTLERIDDRDWERVWLDRFQPMRFGRRLWIRPSGHEVEQSDAVVVDLDPGLAFGTGTHPTTSLCLTWLDGQDLEGKSIIDFGCGSGVLAIAALKLGARHALAIDHDPQALLATQTNAKRNGVADRIETIDSADFDGGQADIVLANILANVLIDLAPAISGLVHPGGRLALSGILRDQVPSVVAAYQEQLHLASPHFEQEWGLLSGNKDSV